MVKYTKMFKPVSLNLNDGIDVYIYIMPKEILVDIVVWLSFTSQTPRIYIYIYIYDVSVAWHHCLHPL